MILVGAATLAAIWIMHEGTLANGVERASCLARSGSIRPACKFVCCNAITDCIKRTNICFAVYYTKLQERRVLKYGIPFRTKISNAKSSNEVDMNCKMSRISKLQKCKGRSRASSAKVDQGPGVQRSNRGGVSPLHHSLLFLFPVS